MTTMSGSLKVAETAEASPVSLRRESSLNLHTDPRLRTLAKLVEQYDRQNAVAAHTVYRVNGKVVCVVARDGRTLFDSAEDFRLGGGLKPSDVAGDLGLAGDQYIEFIAREISLRLGQEYQGALEILSFGTGSAPSLGELREEMFGIPRERLWAIDVGASLGIDAGEASQGILVFPKN